MSGVEVLLDEGLQVFFISELLLEMEVDPADVGIGGGVCSPAVEVYLLLKEILAVVGRDVFLVMILSHGNYKIWT